jgi:hypothetical protein
MKHPQGLQLNVPKHIFIFANNLFELEKKMSVAGDASNFSRNITKMKEALEELGITYENPEGEPFSETRTDLDASISGNGTENLVVVEVIKPIIRAGTSGISTVIQKGIVVVESKKKGEENE